MKAVPRLFRHLLFPVVLVHLGSEIAAKGNHPGTIETIEASRFHQHRLDYNNIRSKRNATRNSGRIIGGRLAERSKYPFVVSIQAYHNNGWAHHCGGSIISKRAILTACHCVVKGTNWDPPKLVDPRMFRVVAGVHNLEASRAKQVRMIERVEAHPKCGNKPHYLSYDVGTYILESPLTYTATVRPLKVVSRNPVEAIREFSSLTKNGAACYSPGWGTTKSPGYFPSRDLRVASLRLFTTKQCQKFFCKHTNDYCDLDYSDAKQVCAAGSDSSDCNGDSGGPLVCTGRIFGTVSWRIKCEFGWPHVFTNIIPILDMVNKYSETAPKRSPRRSWNDAPEMVNRHSDTVPIKSPHKFWYNPSPRWVQSDRWV